MFKDIEVCAILLAAGGGCRFGGTTPKQFLMLGDKPVYQHSLRTFEENKFIDRVIMVTPNYLGGTTRQHSVRNALSLLENEGFVGIIIIHDAARPFARNVDIEAVLTAAHAHGAATLATPVTDTIKLVNSPLCEGTFPMVQSTLPREQLYAVQTPQAFRADILYAAHKMTKDGGYDDCQLVENIGVHPAIVAGCTLNIKITHQIDMVIAENILRRGTCQ